MTFDLLCSTLYGNGRLSLSLTLSLIHIQGFDQPHDLTVDPLNKAVYVTEIGPNRIWKFVPVNRKSIPDTEMFSCIILPGIMNIVYICMYILHALDSSIIIIKINLFFHFWQ